MKIIKGVIAGVFGLGIFYGSLLGGIGSIQAKVKGVDLPIELIITSVIGAIFGLILIYVCYLIFTGKSNERLENGLATTGLGLLLLFFWPYRQFHNWKSGNSDFSSSSLVWGSVVTMVAILRGISLLYRRQRRET